MATRKARGSTRRPAAKKQVARKASARTSAARKRTAGKASPGKARAHAGAKAAPTKTPLRRKRAPAMPAAGRRGAARKAAPRGTTAPRKAAARPAAAQAPIDPSLFPCGDAAIRAATGKSWSEWLALLDDAGAASRSLDHQRIWDLVMQALPETAAWWGQMVSVGYERARGLREKHESCNGEFQATLSKTFAAPLFAAFAAWADASLRRQWLEAPDLAFTKLNAGKNIRARWPDGALLDIRFNATGPDKCQIVVDTMKLADAEAVRSAKAFWRTQFERLRGYLGV